jgi:hypothetical protein
MSINMFAQNAQFNKYMYWSKLALLTLVLTMYPKSVNVKWIIKLPNQSNIYERLYKNKQEITSRV